MIADDDLIFVDTNVLLYVLDMSHLQKHTIARGWVDYLWATSAGVLSWQVLNECYENAVRKLQAPAKIVRPAVETYSQWRIAEFSLPVLRRAWHWMDTAGVPYWDSLIVAAAESARCRYLLSEDFQEGRRFGAIEVVNPFRTAPASLFQ